MGASARKKKEKKKDFQKPKLKVGRTKPKAVNFTDTSFTSKGIVVREQSLHTTAPPPSAQIAHYIALLSSRSDTQRRDALGFIHHAISVRSDASSAPAPTAVLLPKLLPLLLDGSSSVRAQLLKVLVALPVTDVEGSAAILLPYIRAGMTHLATDIRASAMDVLDWAIAAAGLELVSCAGGWAKTLKSFLAALGWAGDEQKEAKDEKGAGGWTAGRASFGRGDSGKKPMVKGLRALAAFLRLGLVENHTHSTAEDQSFFPLRHVGAHALPQQSNCYGYLNLFGALRDEDHEIYEDVEARRRVFNIKFRRPIEKGFEAAKSEGGEVGRAAAVGDGVLKASHS